MFICIFGRKFNFNEVESFFVFYSLIVNRRFTEVDPRSEPLVSERVPYVVIYGDPNLPLIKLVRKPEEYFENPAMRLNAHYYIEKVIIPALNRCLKLAKMDASKW